MVQGLLQKPPDLAGGVVTELPFRASHPPKGADFASIPRQHRAEGRAAQDLGETAANPILFENATGLDAAAGKKQGVIHALNARAP